MRSAERGAPADGGAGDDASGEGSSSRCRSEAGVGCHQDEAVDVDLGSTDACWLPVQAQRGLAERLAEMWVDSRVGGAEGNGDGDGVLWAFMDWIASGEFVRDARCELACTGDEIR